MACLSPSILAADFTILGEQLSQLEQSDIQWVHIDVMDGAFVPSISFGMPVIQSIRKKSKLFFDVHLMIQEPIRYIREFKAAGADLISIHVEACENTGQTLEAIKQEGCLAGITLNPETPVSAILPWLSQVDLVLVMSVHPGFGGQAFIEETLDKVREIKAVIQKEKLQCHLEVDGGINIQNAERVLEAGADILVAGTAVFKGNIKENIETFFHVMKV